MSGEKAKYMGRQLKKTGAEELSIWNESKKD